MDAEECSSASFYQFQFSGFLLLILSSGDKMKKLLAIFLLASCVSVTGDDVVLDASIQKQAEFRKQLNYPKCFLVVSGHDWGYETEFWHENSHCWGWTHPLLSGTSRTERKYVDAPQAYVNLGIYPNIVYPCGKRCDYHVATALCQSRPSCMWHYSLNQPIFQSEE